ncbi:GPI transamidase component PIG-S-like [Amphibalanus amphitrite]|uniref:GPI transamidase component PIG-S-like n=1 Tax=Amphibalanus amphitrite TaxID=1232801 RepID=UPI001C90EC81|nr:GPI transamidase component PIG-S-like [Amphibalanus amphitrite]XP_043196306.1 GPI transamidase component PIG-S-like [Amphibalanus amphitrite]XP_043196307.1 GPI transamidase component PIG-S-like [Amphibalanus amphitrite]XP_043196308.1 GPI transamidase component PIG-S-like [Amphibalanus amphitrite]
MAGGSGGADAADDTRTARSLAALSFAITVIAVGVPVWLKTTEIYRAAIPYGGIAGLQELELRVGDGARLEVLAENGPAAERLAAGLAPLLPDCRLDGRSFTEAERGRLAAAADPWAADDALNSVGESDHLRLIVLPERLVPSAAAPVMFGRYTDVLVTSAVGAEQLAALLRQTVVGDVSDAVATRRVRSAPAYDLLVSVAAPRPLSPKPLWDGSGAAGRLLEPVIERLRPLANISVKSQHLYHADLGVRPGWDDTAGEYFLSEEQLSLVVTPLEARLGASVSGRPTLQFVVYVPSPAERPLHLRPAGAADAFLSPRWGGVQVYNPPAGQETVDARRVVTVLVTQLRLLLGVPEPPLEAVVRPAGPSGLRGWELMALRRLRAVENVESARRNLASLAAMLEQISNIVIDDSVGAAVQDGVAAAEEAARYLAEGREADAYASSCRALANSERAIYDPSMLALLYFPDDQKYAIYIPLFLPVSIPVLMSLRSIWGWARGAPEKVKAE